MLSKIAMLGIILALQLAIGASGSLVQAADLQNGAKKVQIVQFYTPQMPHSELPECLANIPETEFAAKQFVKVQYRHARHIFSTIVELPESMHAKLDDTVEVVPSDCSHGKFSRISRVLSPASADRSQLTRDHSPADADKPLTQPGA